MKITRAAALFYAIFLAVSSPARAGDRELRGVLEERYGRAAAAEMISSLDGAAAAGLPSEFLSMRLREAAAKKVPPAAVKKMLSARIRRLTAARRLAAAAESAGFRGALRDDFVVRMSDELEAGAGEDAVLAALSADFRHKTPAALLNILFAMRHAARITGDETAAVAFAASLARLRPEVTAQLASRLSMIPASAAPAFRAASSAFVSTRDSARLSAALKKIAASRWKTETETEISDDKKLR